MRTPGWTKLAAPALELAALAFGAFAMELARSSKPGSKRPAPPPAATPPPPTPKPPPPPPPVVFGEPWTLRPTEFLTEIADEGTNYYRATDDSVDMLAAVYSDGRIRLADDDGRRFAGALIGGHADLLELRDNDWSEVFVRVTPTGRMQLELRGGPYDAHVLTCEPWRT